MLKNSLFIMILHNKSKNIYVSLDTFNSVIINNRKFAISDSAKFLDSKRFPSNWKPFFIPKNFTLLT